MFRQLFLIFTFFIFWNFSVLANYKDSVLIPAKNYQKNRMILTAVSQLSVATLSNIGTWNFWYKNQKLTALHSFDDSKEWGGMDKLGHAYTANKITGLSTKMAYWSGAKPWKARAYGFGVAFAYQTSLEFMDGLSKDWGFSWTDVLANTSGSGLYIFQDWAWQEQRILLKFSYAHTRYAAFRPNTLGKSFGERLFKDYNGQTYWMSANISPFMSKDTKFPKWINLAIGHSMDQKLFGFEKNSLFVRDGQQFTFQAQHQWLLSLDIDFTRIKTNKRLLRNVFTVLNLVKIPFPALQFQGGKFGFSPSSY